MLSWHDYPLCLSAARHLACKWSSNDATPVQDARCLGEIAHRAEQSSLVLMQPVHKGRPLIWGGIDGKLHVSTAVRGAVACLQSGPACAGQG